MQMSILVSSKASLLGTSDSVTLGAVIDGIIEKKMGADHAAISRYYRPDVHAQARDVKKQHLPKQLSLAHHLRVRWVWLGLVCQHLLWLR